MAYTAPRPLFNSNALGMGLRLQNNGMNSMFGSTVSGLNQLGAYRATQENQRYKQALMNANILGDIYHSNIGQENESIDPLRLQNGNNIYSLENQGIDGMTDARRQSILNPLLKKRKLLAGSKQKEINNNIQAQRTNQNIAINSLLGQYGDTNKDGYININDLPTNVKDGLLTSGSMYADTQNNLLNTANKDMSSSLLYDKKIKDSKDLLNIKNKQRKEEILLKNSVANKLARLKLGADILKSEYKNAQSLLASSSNIDPSTMTPDMISRVNSAKETINNYPKLLGALIGSKPIWQNNYNNSNVKQVKTNNKNTNDSVLDIPPNSTTKYVKDFKSKYDKSAIRYNNAIKKAKDNPFYKIIASDLGQELNSMRKKPLNLKVDDIQGNIIKQMKELAYRGGITKVDGKTITLPMFFSKKMNQLDTAISDVKQNTNDFKNSNLYNKFISIKQNLQSNYDEIKNSIASYNYDMISKTKNTVMKPIEILKNSARGAELGASILFGDNKKTELLNNQLSDYYKKENNQVDNIKNRVTNPEYAKAFIGKAVMSAIGGIDSLMKFHSTSYTGSTSGNTDIANSPSVSALTKQYISETYNIPLNKITDDIVTSFGETLGSDSNKNTLLGGIVPHNEFTTEGRKFINWLQAHKDQINN